MYYSLVHSQISCIMKVARISRGSSNFFKDVKYLNNFQQKRNFFKRPEAKDVVHKNNFTIEDRKTKEVFIELVEKYKVTELYRRGHCEFIQMALKNMEEFDAHRDLEAYKQILDVFPKGKFIPQNVLQIAFFHYPKQQYTCIDLLEQMERFSVMPDKEFRDILISIFGSRNYALHKFGRMMYWMPKFKNMNPYYLPNPVPNDIWELALLAGKRMAVDLQTKITTFYADELKTSVDKTWIVSCQSPTQVDLLKEHPKDDPINIEGPFTVWLRKKSISYFILRGKPKEVAEVVIDRDDVSNLESESGILAHNKTSEITRFPTVHEQEDGTIFAYGMTGTSSRDSLLSWIVFLQRENPVLKEIPILFTLKVPSKDVIPLNHTTTDYDSIQEPETLTINDFEKR